jgi:hypothetical protein
MSVLSVVGSIWNSAGSGADSTPRGKEVKEDFKGVLLEIRQALDVSSRSGAPLTEEHKAWFTEKVQPFESSIPDLSQRIICGINRSDEELLREIDQLFDKSNKFLFKDLLQELKRALLQSITDENPLDPKQRTDFVRKLIIYDESLPDPKLTKEIIDVLSLSIAEQDDQSSGVGGLLRLVDHCEPVAPADSERLLQLVTQLMAQF